MRKGMQLRKFVIEEWLAARWQLTSHALYYKIPYMQHCVYDKQGKLKKENHHTVIVFRMFLLQKI